ncbi:MAG: hypothetical protein MZW92_64635 [Comamonadaceae bacterium]|nr:hypothetical protein [Comamonadaceae bacterium]
MQPCPRPRGRRRAGSRRRPQMPGRPAGGSMNPGDVVLLVKTQRQHLLLPPADAAAQARRLVYVNQPLYTRHRLRPRPNCRTKAYSACLRR